MVPADDPTVSPGAGSEECGKGAEDDGVGDEEVGELGKVGCDGDGSEAELNLCKGQESLPIPTIPFSRSGSCPDSILSSLVKTADPPAFKLARNECCSTLGEPRGLSVSILETLVRRPCFSIVASGPVLATLEATGVTFPVLDRMP